MIGDAVEGDVELAVAAAGEAVTGDVRRPDRAPVPCRCGGRRRRCDRKRPMPAVSPTSLAAVSGPQPGEREQGRRQGGTEVARSRARAVDGEASARGSGRRGRGRCGRPCRRGRRGGPRGPSRTWRRSSARGAGSSTAQLVEVPAQAALEAGCARRRGPRGGRRGGAARARGRRAGDRQVGLAQGRPGDREGVDGVALAGLPDRAAGTGHELGRDAHDGLAGARAGRARGGGTGGGSPRAPSAAPGSRPAQASGARGARRRRRHRPLGELAAVLVDGHDRVRRACADRLP